MSKKSVLLQKWLNKIKESEAAPEAKGRGTDPLPLLPNQKAIYFLTSLDPENSFYNVSNLYLFKGPVNKEFIKRSFEEIFKAHDVFRTQIISKGGIVLQGISNNSKLDFIHHPNSNNPKKVIIDDAKKPFDLSKGSLLRISLVSDSDKTYVGITAHHLVVDLWSLGQIKEDLAKLYNGFSKGHSYNLEINNNTYRDYVKERLRDSKNKESLNYWINKIDGKNDNIHLPYDYQRPPEPTYRGSILTSIIPEEISKEISSLCAKNEVTPFVFLLTVFFILLKKYGNSESINIGVPFSDKIKVDYEKVIGFFDETVILSSGVRNQSFLDLLLEIKSTVLEAFEHKDIPLEEIVKELNPDRSHGINPLFQIMFVYNRESEEPEFGEGLQFSSEYLDIGVSKFDLTLFTGENERGFYTSFEYSTELFQRSTISRLAKNFQATILEILKDPKIPIQKISGISDEERVLVLDSYRSAGSLKIEGNSILDHIEDQVRSKPNAFAVSDKSGAITYAELWQKSRNVCAYIQSDKIGSGAIVGLLINRSIEMIIGMIGVLRAGAAYLPLDPEYPEERIRYMVEDADVKTIFSGLPDDNTNFKNLKHSDIKKVINNGENLPGDPPSVRPESEAYIIYTSGSTGKPKGVMVSHESLLNSTIARKEHYKNQPESFLLFSSFSFDSSVAGIYWTLISGGKLVILPERAEQDMKQIGHLIVKERITHTLLLPSIYNVFLDTVDSTDLKTLRSVTVAGEAINHEISNKHYSVLPECLLMNEYGPTECTVWSTFHPILKDEDRIPIGKPILNTDTYVLDQDLNLSPIGVPGELYIGGKNLSGGYINDSVKTSNRFIPNPFEKGKKLYKTGDLVKWSDDGNLIFLGRVDDQIKIRGFRVELQEIDAVVSGFNGVNEAATVFDTDLDNGRLKCFYTGQEVDIVELKNYLNKKLPDHMIPGGFREVEKIPRLPNGKVKREALSELDIKTDREINPPQGVVEETLHNIWKDILKLEVIGRHDNFFEIGGDSILSIRIISRAKEKGLDISPRQIFNHKSIAQLAKHVNFKDSDIAKKRSSFFGKTPLSPIQSWFFETKQPHPHFWNQAFKIRISREISNVRLKQFLEYLLQSQDGLRQTFLIDEQQRYWASYKRFSPDELIIEMNSLSGDKFDEKFESLQKNISLEAGPLFRVIVLASRNDHSDFIFLAHHLIIDAVSWDRVMNDFNIFASGGEIRVDNKYQYQDFVNHLHSEEFRNRADKDLEFWKNQMISESKKFVTQDESLEYLNQLHVLSFDEDLLASMKDEIAKVYNLKFHELLACIFVMALLKSFELNKITVWFEHHGRDMVNDRLDLSGSIGWFTSYYPLCFNEKEDLEDQIIHIKDTIRSTPNNGITFGVNKYIEDKSGLSEEPNFTFNFLGIRDSGQFDSLESIEFMKNVRHPQNKKTEIVELNSWIENKKLILNLSINKAAMVQSDDLLNLLTQTKDLIVNHCLNTSGRYSVSDFKEADLSEEDLNNLLDQI